MMRLQRIAAAAACALLLACPVSAQVIGSGHVMGNGTGSPAAPTDTPLSSILAQPGSGLTTAGNTSKLATVSGAIANGHCVSSDANGNLIDAGGACTTGGGGGTVNSGVAPQFGYYASTGSAVSGMSLTNPLLGPNLRNVVAYGADPTGVSASDTAFANALAASTPASIYIPCGTYKLTTAVAYTLSGSQTLTIRGAGRGCTILNFTTSSAGLFITYPTVNPGVNISNLTLTSNQLGNSTAIELFGPASTIYTQPGGWSTIENVECRGDDGPNGTHYWQVCVVQSNMWNVNLINDDFYGIAGHGVGFTPLGSSFIFTVSGMSYPTMTVSGSPGAPLLVGMPFTLNSIPCTITAFGSGSGGAGTYTISCSSTPTTGTGKGSVISIVSNIIGGNFDYLNNGILIGTLSQGITVNGLNAIQNAIGINQGTTNVSNAQFSVVNSQFGSDSYGIFLGSGVVGTTIANNYFISSAGTDTGIQIAGEYNFTISNNYFESEDRTGNEVGVNITSRTGGGGIVTGNVLNNFPNDAIFLSNTSSKVVVNNNFCDNPPTSCVGNAGTGNFVGTNYQ